MYTLRIAVDVESSLVSPLHTLCVPLPCPARAAFPTSTVPILHYEEVGALQVQREKGTEASETPHPFISMLKNHVLAVWAIAVDLQIQRPVQKN